MNTDNYVETFKAMVLLHIHKHTCMYNLTNASFVKSKVYLTPTSSTWDACLAIPEA